MNFRDYCENLASLEEESSRLAMTETLAQLLNSLAQEKDAGELRSGIYMLKGQIAPDFVPIEFNFSNKSFVNALKTVGALLGMDYDPVKKFAQFGDSGLLAFDFIEQLRGGDGRVKKVNQSGFDLDGLNSFDLKDVKNRSISKVHDTLHEFAETSGKDSVKRKSEIMFAFLESASAVEAKYFVRMITGNMRLGVSNKTILDAISWASKGDKSLRKDLDRAFGLQADPGTLAEKVLIKGDDLASVSITPGIPLAAQLVEREKDAEAINKRMPVTIVQPKYDGLRAQVHYRKEGFDGLKDRVAIFSRNMEPLTEMFPDLVELFLSQDFDSIILDGEVIGYDETTETFLPFQETIQRKRKYGVAEKVESIPIKYFLFDLLYLNGEDLTQKPLEERLRTLKNLKFKDPSGRLSITESPVFENHEKLEKYFRELLDQGLEGVIAKSPQSHYMPGKRGYDWIKLKANTYTDLKDSVDAVVMGYYYGRGQRAKFGIGGFLVGIFNEEKGEYQTLAKVGSGVKEEEWTVLKDHLDAFAVKSLPRDYHIQKTMMPDVVVKPDMVFEIDADEITLSSNHTAGLGEASSREEFEDAGFSLRFPRLKKVREDKNPDQTTTVNELKKLLKLSN